MNRNMIKNSKDDRSLRGRAIALIGADAFVCGCGQSDQAAPKAVVATQPSASAPALSVGPSPLAKSTDSPVALLSAAKAEAEAFLRLLPADVPVATAKVAFAFKNS